MDAITLFGALLSVIALAGGVFLEGADWASYLSLSSFLVVVFGTMGATLLSFQLDDVWRAASLFPRTFRSHDRKLAQLVDEISDISEKARDEGLLALEVYVQKVRDPDLKKGIKFILEDYPESSIKEIFDTQISETKHSNQSAVNVFETASYFAPVIGIVGALLVLIRVLSSGAELSTDALFVSLSSAFVSALYGMLLGFFVLTPWAVRIRSFADTASLRLELVRQGVLSIKEGTGPKVVREKLSIMIGAEGA